VRRTRDVLVHNESLGRLRSEEKSCSAWVNGRAGNPRRGGGPRVDLKIRRRVARKGYYVVVMSDDSREIFQCPGCGRSVGPDEDYVIALEYKDEPGFSLHGMSSDAPVSEARRFHVEHFRGRLGDRVYALVDEPSPSY
jgi:hypothetical protein